jgi:prepilin-type N-terminal cleavage/methylation domain-containing protein
MNPARSTAAARSFPAPGRARARDRANRRAFTLFEILVVLAILSIVATIGVPAVLQVAKKNPLRQAVSDLTEACQNARMLAILRGERTELVIDANERSLQVRFAPQAPAGRSHRPGDAFAGPGPEDEAPPGDGGAAPATTAELQPFRATLPENVEFSRLVVNLQDMIFGPEAIDAVQARVRFYPNGTCDAFLAHLLWGETREERKITLEITTGREAIEVVR